jgi:hypothetical protein
MPNYFRLDNRVFLILRRYKQRGVNMLEGIDLNGRLNVTVPLASVLPGDNHIAA